MPNTARALCACSCQCRAAIAANILACTTNTKEGFRHQFNGSSSIALSSIDESTTSGQHGGHSRLRAGLSAGQLQRLRANVAKWAALAAALATAAQWPDMEAVLTALAQQAAAGARAELLPLMQVRCQIVSLSPHTACMSLAEPTRAGAGCHGCHCLRATACPIVLPHVCDGLHTIC